MRVTYLDQLNDDQRAAVVHGVGAGGLPPPLLVIAGAVGSAWDHVLIDEYQDTNRLQARILLALKPDGLGLTVVGDDAQAIYAFRAASVRNILDFPDAFSPRAELSLHHADPPCCERGDRAGAGAVHQEPLDRPDLGGEAAARYGSE